MKLSAETLARFPESAKKLVELSAKLDRALDHELPAGVKLTEFRARQEDERSRLATAGKLAGLAGAGYATQAIARGLPRTQNRMGGRFTSGTRAQLPRSVSGLTQAFRKGNQANIARGQEAVAAIRNRLRVGRAAVLGAFSRLRK